MFLPFFCRNGPNLQDGVRIDMVLLYTRIFLYISFAYPSLEKRRFGFLIFCYGAKILFFVGHMSYSLMVIVDRAKYIAHHLS